MRKALITVSIWVAVPDEISAGNIASGIREAAERESSAHFVYSGPTATTSVEDENEYSRKERERRQAEAVNG